MVISLVMAFQTTIIGKRYSIGNLGGGLLCCEEESRKEKEPTWSADNAASATADGTRWSVGRRSEWKQRYGQQSQIWRKPHKWRWLHTWRFLTDEKFEIGIYSFIFNSSDE